MCDRFGYVINLFDTLFDYVYHACTAPLVDITRPGILSHRHRFLLLPRRKRETDKMAKFVRLIAIEAKLALCVFSARRVIPADIRTDPKISKQDLDVTKQFARARGKMYRQQRGLAQSVSAYTTVGTEQCPNERCLLGLRRGKDRFRYTFICRGGRSHPACQQVLDHSRSGRPDLRHPVALLMNRNAPARRSGKPLMQFLEILGQSFAGVDILRAKYKMRPGFQCEHPIAQQPTEKQGIVLP